MTVKLFTTLWLVAFLYTYHNTFFSFSLSICFGSVWMWQSCFFLLEFACLFCSSVAGFAFFCFSSGRLSKNLHKILIWMIRNESRQSASAFFLGRSSKETSTFSPFYYVKCEREAQIEYCHLLKRNLWSLSFVSGFRLGAMRLAETPTTIQSLFGKLPVLITCCWPTIIVCEKSILLIKWTCKGFLFVKWEI